MNWALRYSPHVGYSPPDRLMYRALAGSSRAEHVRFAAQHGMAGILYPWAADGAPDERAAVKIALRETGLECSCIVATPMSALADPIWVTDSTAARSELIRYVGSALQIAKELGSTTLAVLIRADGSSARSTQWHRAIGQLHAAADLVAAEGIVLAIEPMIRLSDMLLRTFEEGVELARAVAHPAVKLIFDTGHVTDMGDALLPTYVESYEEIQLLQLADMPGRIEVGAGTIDFIPLLSHAIRRGYRGLVDLEHDWDVPGEDAERKGIERLAAIDAAARTHAGI